MPVLEREVLNLQLTPEVNSSFLRRPPGRPLDKLSTGENSSLFDHIQYFKINFRREELPDNWSDLPGTGFMINKQLDLLNLDNSDKNANKEKWLAQTNRDIKGFILEYLAEGLVFPINYYIDSGGHLVDKNYGNKRVMDAVSEEERSGSVRKVIGEKLEPFLASSSDDSIAVMDSPAGWSGLHQEDGKSIMYPDSQTYIFQKRGNEIVGFTIRTDFTPKEHREVIRRLTGETLSEDASVVEYVKHGIALIGAGSNPNLNEIKDVVKLMEDTRRNIHESLLAYKNRTWNEVYRDLERGNELWHYDETTGKMIQEFKDYVLDNELTRQEMKEALAVTILRIAKFLRKDIKDLSNERVIFPTSAKAFTYQAISQVSYGSILTKVQKLPGCAGGGSKNGTSLIRSLTPRFGQIDLSLGQEWFHCPECGFQADGPIGDTCPGCKLTKDEYAQETGISCG